jgi:hypothetical protein
MSPKFAPWDPQRFISHPSVRRAALWPVALAIAAWPARALAGPADTDEPLIDPRMELDPRLDLPEPPMQPRLPSPLHAPLWVAVSGTAVERTEGKSLFGAMLLLGIPLDRIATHDRGGPAIAEGPSPPPPPAPPPRGAPSPVAPLKPVPQPKLDVAPRPASLKLPSVDAPPPLRIPVRVTPEVARAVVAAALHRAHLAEPDRHLASMVTRVRNAAILPELRIRALREVDQGQTLSPTDYDPSRTTATGGISLWIEARATWRLDRIVFADEEVAIERLAHTRAEARAKLTARVLKLLFEWQRALALADNPAASPEENLTARLKALEAAAELDVLTDGWLGRWREEHAATTTDEP